MKTTAQIAREHHNHTPRPTRTTRPVTRPIAWKGRDPWQTRWEHDGWDSPMSPVAIALATNAYMG